MLNNIFLLKKKYRIEILTILIVILAFYFRTFNVNWDNNFYFHPDERAIAMFTTPLKFPVGLSEFLSIQSPLNPHFFAYGSLPLYLLKVLGEAFSFINPLYNEYGGIHIIGRLISATLDTSTVFVIYLIGTIIANKRSGAVASLLYACSVFPIQLSHFYAVDSMLTFFMTTTIYIILKYIGKANLRNAIFIGLFFGLALATKISSAIIFIGIIYSFLINYFSNKKIKAGIIRFIVLIFATFSVFVITQPYTVIDSKNFIEQTRLQSQMSNNAFLFPYTLQYVNKIPYLHELKNIILWGQGPFISLLCFSGIIVTIIKLKKIAKLKRKMYIFLLLYIGLYFLVFGKFAVGWMRYMLPIYPILALFGGAIVDRLLESHIDKKYSRIFKNLIAFTFFMIVIFYPLSFLSIYTKPNTRLVASQWILQNIPEGSKLAIEHWDDALPVVGGERYTHLTLPLYEPDTNEKWIDINNTLTITDYIVIASNRLYVPLQKLTDCNNLPSGRCYLRTSKYYKDLFAEKLGFVKVAEFSSYPTIPILNTRIIDDSADESFTVYDHPKIFVFKRIDLRLSTH